MKKHKGMNGVPQNVINLFENSNITQDVEM